MHVSGAAFVALSQAVERVDQAAQGVARATQPAGGADQVDLSTEAVGLLVAKHGYDAAVKLAKATGGMEEKVIDLLA